MDRRARSRRATHRRQAPRRERTTSVVASAASSCGLLVAHSVDGVARGGGIAVGAAPGIDLALGFVARDAVALLDPAHHLIALAGDDVHVVIGQLAPLLLDLPLHLLPVAF